MDVVVKTQNYYHRWQIEPRGSKGIFPEMSQLVLRQIAQNNLKGKRVLDVGTGNGLLAFAAAEAGAKVVHGIDVNPEAIEWARRSQGQQNLSSMHFANHAIESWQSDEPYNLIICNAAQLPLPEPYDFFGEGNYFVGEDGMSMIRALYLKLPYLMAENARLWLVHTGLADLNFSVQFLEENGYDYQITDGETLPLYRHVAARPELVDYLKHQLCREDGEWKFRFYLLEVEA